MKFDKHIKDLLFRYDCVVLPNLGAFITRNVSSNIDEINNNLKKIALKSGISLNDFDKCLENDVISNKILNDRIDGQKKYSINSTPTIIINEKKLEGSASFKNIKKKIEKLI